MKILFDSSTPATLAFALRPHEVTRTGQLGWQSWEDGVLLSAAETAGFDLLITCDQNISYQQNFTDRKISVIILSSNRWPMVRPVAAQIATAVNFMQRGQVRRIDVLALSRA